jgi:hypothetical protein
MVDKKDKELTDKDLKKATGGTGPIVGGGHTLQSSPPQDLDEPKRMPQPGGPRTRPGKEPRPL